MLDSVFFDDYLHFISLGNCSGSFNPSKKGAGILGKYDSLRVGDNSYNVLSEIGYYRILAKDFSCEITAEGALPFGKKYLAGTFTCKAYKDSDSSKVIPVSGSFRLYRY